MITEEMLIDSHRWHYLNPTDPYPLSGWKLHIFGNTLNDSVTVGNAIEPVLNKYGLMAKIASNYLVCLAIGRKDHSQYGKIATIYLSSSLFLRKVMPDLIRDLQNALYNAEYTKTGDIYGDKSIDRTLHYRYELYKVVDPEKGVEAMDYQDSYEVNRGEFNIPGNPDIWDLFQEKMCGSKPENIT